MLELRAWCVAGAMLLCGSSLAQAQERVSLTSMDRSGGQPVERSEGS